MTKDEKPGKDEDANHERKMSAAQRYEEQEPHDDARKNVDGVVSLSEPTEITRNSDAVRPNGKCFV
jgi:hypothetical protein